MNRTPVERTTRLRALISAGLVAASLLPAMAQATDVDASLTGLMEVRPTIVSAEERSFVPFIAQLGLRVSEKSLWKFDEVRVEVGAWGRLAVLNTTNSGDVDVAYVSAKAFDKRFTLSLGRQFRSGGAARGLHLDGLAAEVVLPGNLGLSAFGGAPVIRRFALARGDAVWGARLFWRPTWETELGASYFELLDVGYTARRDVALDFRTLLARRLSLSGLGVFSTLETRVAEADLRARWVVARQVELSGGVRHTAPDLFLPRTSIFSVFADVTRTEGLLAVDYTPTQRATLGIEGRAISVAEGLGYEALGTFGYAPSRDARASFQVMRLALPSNAYTRARLAGRRTFGNVTLAADVDGALFDAPINGRTTSLQGTLTAKLALPANFDLLVSGLAATDPLFQQRFEVLARLVYTFRIHTEGAR